MESNEINKLSLEEAKNCAGQIIERINETLDSIEQKFPNKGYGKFAKSLSVLRDDIDDCTGSFLSSQKINKYVYMLFSTFSKINPIFEKNLQDLFQAHIEISNFLLNNKNTGIEFSLLKFTPSRIKNLKENNEDLNEAMTKFKDSNYKDRSLLRGIFSIFSSIVEISEEMHRNELTEYQDKINQYAKQNKMPYVFPYDPVTVFGIGGVVSYGRKNKQYTRQRALRHLISHNHFKQDLENNTLHFKNPDNDPKWQFDFDQTLTNKEFCKYVGSVDMFYKSAVCLKFSFILQAILSNHFENKGS